ncbi:DUF4350 domain-containing protein [Fredinandcohnia quinoae]|uniref:DUF4350 domain-containing protein n=1 Tax=Fredinandcohnia quinoae TaxID=2918902 RepID=A0AAW5EAJ9_9BACI|nr:DUF4350 domain-containing protein [Fredinandcohnia sp. SECRCQ15]MCH1626695.1 DUF4350 domain-containing protein [Fredinandcohnia sp. SECRCQ15]
MQKLKSRRRTWIWLIVLLFLFMALSYFIQSKEPTYYPSYVSKSPSPTGVKAFYTYLKNETEVKKWTHSPTLLSKHTDDQMLIMIEPFSIPTTEEMNAYEDFMKAGNTIILFKSNPKGMFDLKVEPFDFDIIENEMTVYTQAGKSYEAEVNSSVRLIEENHSEILLHDDAGVIALKKSFGNGELIVSLTPEWLMNGKIVEADNIPLIISLLNEENHQMILFDEYTYVGDGNSTLLAVYPKWFVLVIILGIIIMLLYLWNEGKRFGPIFTPREESVRFSDEGLRALTAWYLKGNRYHDSLKIQADYNKLLMQERWGIPYKKEWLDLTTQLELKLSNSGHFDIKAFINGLNHVLNKGKISKQEYVLWSKKLDRLRKEVEDR